jgi:hypothetical protein
VICFTIWARYIPITSGTKYLQLSWNSLIP